MLHFSWEPRYDHTCHQRKAFNPHLVWSRPFQVEREEGSGDTAIPNVCLVLRSVRANQIARATSYFPSHVIVIRLLSQWRREDNQIHSQSKKISELTATLTAHSWTRLQRHRSQRSSYLYDISKCLNDSARYSGRTEIRLHSDNCDFTQ